MSEQLIFINRRSGVAHVDFWCPAIAAVPTECLRVEAYDPDRPRRKCSVCWGGCPRRSVSAGTAGPVTERSEGNPRSGLTGADGTAIPATERAAALGGQGAKQPSDGPVGDDSCQCEAEYSGGRQRCVGDVCEFERAAGVDVGRGVVPDEVSEPCQGAEGRGHSAAGDEAY